MSAGESFWANILKVDFAEEFLIVFKQVGLNVVNSLMVYFPENRS
jgi:hypothetical protein